MTNETDLVDGLYSTQLAAYIDKLTPQRDPELLAMEASARASGFPIIGPASGHFCYQMARIIGARHIFELGSGFGYSTAWFARAVHENGGGEVHHVVWDETISRDARGSLERLGYGELVWYHVGEAVQTLRQQKRSFDLIFLDIDKNGYPAALPVIAGKLRAGGLLIVDNLLWHGRVFDENDKSADTIGIHETTRLLTESEEWVTTLVPIRDGLMVAFKV
jgi:caffeoyl-CoA O-methyltransferase